MFEPPSPDTRIVTAPASAASSLLTDPGHGSQRAPFGQLQSGDPRPGILLPSDD